MRKDSQGLYEQVDVGDVLFIIGTFGKTILRIGSQMKDKGKTIKKATQVLCKRIDQP